MILVSVILTPEDFVGEANIPNLDSKPVQEKLRRFIQKYEPIYLRALLGEELYNQLAESLAENPIPDKWGDLVEILNEPLTYFVFWHWLKSNNTYTNRSGVSKSKSENADNVSPADKMVQVWNDMVDTNWDIVKSWNAALYGDYYRSGHNTWYNRDVRDIFTRQNTFNI